jgi:hypothetical protein
VHNIDILSSKYRMLHAALLLDTYGICMFLSDLFSKVTPLISQRDNPIYFDQLISFSFFSGLILLSFIPLIYFWIFGSLFNFKEIKDEVEATKSQIYSLHTWHFIISFLCLIETPCSIIFLTSGVYIGAALRPMDTYNHSNLFFTTTYAQKKGDLSY